MKEKALDKEYIFVPSKEYIYPRQHSESGSHLRNVWRIELTQRGWQNWNVLFILDVKIKSFLNQGVEKQWEAVSKKKRRETRLNLSIIVRDTD